MKERSKTKNVSEWLAKIASEPSCPERVLDYLDGADSEAPMRGLSGLQPVLYYRMIQKVRGQDSESQYWSHLFETARFGHQMSVAVRSLIENANNCDGEENAGEAWMAVGHYFRFSIGDSEESAKAYLKSARPEQNDALSAILALQRLNRSDPECVLVREVIEQVRGEGLLPTQTRENIEDQLGLIPSEDTESRAHVLIELAKVMIVSWGDASRALDWLETAYSLKASPMQIVPVCRAIVAAMPDSVPTLVRALELLVKCRAWREIDQIARFMSYLDLAGTDVGQIRMTFSMVYALQLNDEKHAACELYCAAVQNPIRWKEAVRQHAWIGIYAADHPIFRRALVDAMASVGCDDLDKEITAFYEKFGRSPILRKQAIFKTLYRLIQSQNYSDVLKKIERCLNQSLAIEDGAFYEVLLDMVSRDDIPQGIQRNAQILITAEKIFEAGRDTAAYRKFLTDTREILNQTVHSEECRGLLQQVELTIHAIDSGHLQELIDGGGSVNAAEIMVHSGDQETEEPEVVSGDSDVSFTFVSQESESNEEPADASDTDSKCIPSPDSEAVRKGISDLWKESSETRISHWKQLDNSWFGCSIPGDVWKEEEICGYSLTALNEPGQILEKFEAGEPGAYAEDQWILVTRILCRYLPYVQNPEEVCGCIQKIIDRFIPRDRAFSMLLSHFDLCLQYDLLFEQVIRMSENPSQTQQMMEKIDDAIAAFSGNDGQCTALYIKKYRLAEILGDDRARMSCIRELLAIDSENAFAREALVQIRPDRLNAGAQVQYYQLCLDTQKDPRERLRLQMTLVRLYLQTGQVQSAVSLYYSIIAEHPEYLEARYRLLDLLESQKHWKSAENVLLELVNVEPSVQERYKCLIHLAQLQCDQLSMPDRAILTYFEALALYPEKLTELHPVLCRVSEQMRTYSPVTDKYEDWMRHAGSRNVRRTCAVYLARIYLDVMQKPALAGQVLDDYYWQEGSGDSEFLQQAVKFYGDLKNWNSYVRCVSQLMPLMSGSSDRVQLALSAARVYADKLGDHVHAARLAQTAAEANPKTVAQWLEIADFLLRAELTQDVVVALENAARLENNESRKLRIYLELARQYAVLDELDRATLAFHHALEFHPELSLITPIAEDLIAHATAHKNKDAFIALCHDLIMSCPESEQTALMLQQALTLVQVYHDKETARRIIRDNTGRLTAIDVDQSLILMQILTHIGEHDSAIRLIQSVMTKFSLDDDQKQLCLKTLLTNASALDDTATVQVTADAILKRSPKDPDARFYLAQMDYKAGRWDEATEKYQELLPDIEQLAPDKAQQLYTHYAEILHAAQHDDIAIAYLDNALRIDMHFRPAVDLKLTILLGLQRWPEALPIFDLLLELTDDADEKGAIHKRIAEIYHFYLHDNDRAIREYEYAVTLGGDVEDVPVRLLQLYGDTEQWEKAAVTADVLAQAQTDSAFAKCDYLVALAKIQFNHLHELDKATKSYTGAFQIDPLNPDIVRPLTQLIVMRKSWQDLDVLVQEIGKQLDNASVRASQLLSWIAQKCGRIYECKTAIAHAQDLLEQHQIHIQLDLRAEDPDPEWLKPLPKPAVRVRATTLRAAENRITAGFSDDDDNEDEDLNELVRDVRPGSSANRDMTSSLPAMEPVGRMPSAVQLRFSINPLETLSFTMDDLNGMDSVARQNKDTFTVLCLSELFNQIGQRSDRIVRKPLPGQLNEKTVGALLSLQDAVPDADLARLLSILAVCPSSPMLVEGTEILDDQDVGSDYYEIFSNLRELLNASSIELRDAAMINPLEPLTRTQPPGIRCTSNLEQLSLEDWTAHLTSAIVLARPESKLLFSMPLSQIARELIDISKFFHSDGTDVPGSIVKSWLDTLKQGGISVSEFPVFDDTVLARLKRLSAHYRRNALQGALVMSQSLTSVMKLISECEGCTYPKSMATLKSAMKQSELMKNMLIFALSTNAQHLYREIFG